MRLKSQSNFFRILISCLALISIGFLSAKRTGDTYEGTPYGIMQNHPWQWFSASDHVSSGMRKKNVERYDRFISLSSFVAGENVVLCGETDLHLRLMYGLARVDSVRRESVASKTKSELLDNGILVTRKIGAERSIFLLASFPPDEIFVSMFDLDYVLHAGPC